MEFPPEVERWRSLVAKYFPPESVDKALWTIMYESSGNPSAVGDGGAARGRARELGSGREEATGRMREEGEGKRVEEGI